MGDLSRWQRDADALAQALADLAIPLAESTPEQPLDAATPEQTDFAKAMMTLHRWIPGFVAKIVPGDVRNAEWLNLAHVLEALAAAARREHRQHVVLDMPDDTGDSGGR